MQALLAWLAKEQQRLDEVRRLDEAHEAAAEELADAASDADVARSTATLVVHAAAGLAAYG